MNTTLKQALSLTSRSLSVDLKLVESVYKSYWSFIKTQISCISFVDMSEDELCSTETNFNLPYIGKLYTDYEKIQKLKRQQNFYENVTIKKNQTHRQSGVSD